MSCGPLLDKGTVPFIWKSHPFSLSLTSGILVLWFRYHLWQEVSTGIYSSLLSTPITPGCSPVAALNTTRLLSNYLCMSLPLPSQILNNMRTGSGSIFSLLTVSFMKWMLNLCSVEVTIENDWTGHWSTNPELFFLSFFFFLKKLQVECWNLTEELMSSASVYRLAPLEKASESHG